jgi:isopentenyl diphosphate isomerase/L-lactate dehydrogenase-like FMN-dependent dehydrogenase
MPITDHSTWTPTTLIPRVGLRPSLLNTRGRTFGRVMMEKYLLSTPVCHILETPRLMIDPGQLEAKAKEKLSEGGWYYASSNAGMSTTHLANRQAFFRHRIIPRMLVDTNTRDTATEIWGHKVAAPIGFAPIGINKIYNPLGELPVAKVAEELNLPYCLSTAGSQPIEDVGKANGNGPRFFQLYMPHDDELTISLLTRAHESGFTACILTLDTWQLGWRHNDVNNSNYAFYHGIGADLGLSDPVFQKRLKEAGIDPKTQLNEAGAMWIDNVWHGRAHTWEKTRWVMGEWKRISGGKPFALKGIQDVRDAQKSVEMGVDGIVVSNHAGRQVDGAIASLDALENIVAGTFPILLLPSHSFLLIFLLTFLSQSLSPEPS